MHSDYGVIILAAIIFANACTLVRSIEGEQFESKSIEPMQIKYKLFPRPLDGDGATIFKIEKKMAAMGYVYKGRITTTSNGTVVKTLVFINIDNSKATYQVQALIAPSTSAELLKQLNAQGAKGYRFSGGLAYKTGQYYEYVRETSRPSAKYIYRHEPCVSNSEELFAQINDNAAQGYRVLDTFEIDNHCFLYIKDRSKHFNFVYKMVSEFNTTEELIARADQLGARGYRHVGDKFAGLLTDGYIRYTAVPIYYRDRTQEDCTFSYSSAPVPDSPDEALAILEEQEAEGFLYSFTYDTFDGSFLIFVKFEDCHYKGLNIDAPY